MYWSQCPADIRFWVNVNCVNRSKYKDFWMLSSVKFVLCIISMVNFQINKLWVNFFFAKDHTFSGFFFRLPSLKRCVLRGKIFMIGSNGLTQVGLGPIKGGWPVYPGYLWMPPTTHYSPYLLPAPRGPPTFFRGCTSTGAPWYEGN